MTDHKVAFGGMLVEEFLVISERDLGWKRPAYTLLPTNQQYVIIAQEQPSVLSFSRARGWEQARLTASDAALDLPALGIDLPLRAIYRYTGLA